MNTEDVQRRMAALGTYPADRVDGIGGPLTRAGLVDTMTIGNDNPITALDLKMAADELGVDVAKVKALSQVEAAGEGFSEGRPKILFEPHVFSRLTGGAFDKTHPAISYPRWGARPYPRSQNARYACWAEAVCLNVNAGLSAASYGGFQILGENWHRCGYSSPWAFAYAQSQSGGDQLEAFVRFCKSDARLLAALRTGDWTTVARRYNGSAYATHAYDKRLEQAYEKEKRNAG